jgi:hypothetical protein
MCGVRKSKIGSGGRKTGTARALYAISKALVSYWRSSGFNWKVKAQWAQKKGVGCELEVVGRYREINPIFGALNFDTSGFRF